MRLYPAEQVGTHLLANSNLLLYNVVTTFRQFECKWRVCVLRGLVDWDVPEFDSAAGVASFTSERHLVEQNRI